LYSDIVEIAKEKTQTQGKHYFKNKQLLFYGMSYHMPLDKNAYSNQFKTYNHGMTMHV
jgi:hypothetical protein